MCFGFVFASKLRVIFFKTHKPVQLQLTHVDTTYVSRQTRVDTTLWAGKVNQSCTLVGYPRGHEVAILPIWDCLLHLRPTRKWCPVCLTINLLLAKLVGSRWLDIGIHLFLGVCVFFFLRTSRCCVSVHKHVKKILANIQPS